MRMKNFAGVLPYLLNIGMASKTIRGETMNEGKVFRYEVI